MLQHKSWFGAELRFQEVLSIYPPPLAACGAPSKDIFLTRICPASCGTPSGSVEQCNQSSCLRFLAINAEGKASGDSYRKCDLWPPLMLKLIHICYIQFNKIFIQQTKGATHSTGSVTFDLPLISVVGFAIHQQPKINPKSGGRRPTPGHSTGSVTFGLPT